MSWREPECDASGVEERTLVVIGSDGKGSVKSRIDVRCTGTFAAAELGEQMRNIVFVFTTFAIGLVGYDRLRRRGRALPAVGATVLAVLVGVSAIGATVWDVRAGHAGAKATWSDVGSGDRPAGDGDDR